MKKQPVLLLPTNITPSNADWERINFLSALCCYDNPINAEQRCRVPIITKKMSTKELEVAFSEITETYERLLSKVARILNAMHGMSGSVRFWEIQLNLPFLYLISTIYEIRFRLLEAAKAFCGQEWCLAIPKDIQPKLDSQKLFFDRISHVSNVEDWLLYTEVAMAENLPTLGTDVVPESLKDRIKQLELVAGEKIKSKIKKIILSTLKKGFLLINGTGNFFSRSLNNQISVSEDNLLFVSLLSNSKFRLNLIPHIDPGFNKFEWDANMRNKFDDIDAESDFERTIIRLLNKCIPVSLVEGFARTKKLAEPYVAGGLYMLPITGEKEVFKHAVATGVDSMGGRTLYYQNGGGYGHHRNFFPEYLSRRCADYYATNGWQDSYYSGASLVPLPNLELSRIVKKTQKKVVRTQGLFVSTTGYPFIFRGDHWASVEGFEVYYDDQMIFFDELDQAIRKCMAYRPYPGNNLGWDIIDRLKKSFPEVLIAQSGAIHQALNIAKIIIIDHNITSLLMALTMNRPVVCFWQPFLFPLRPDCVADFDQLRKAGILYSDPESAAGHVNTVWQTIDEWWQSNEVQEVRNAFVSKYAQTAPDCAMQWRDILQRILISDSEKSN